MIVLRTDRKHASNCMTEENGVEKVKKRKNFFRSLRFRILIILIILGIVPGVIVTYTMLHNYQNRAVAMLTETVGDQCDILCNLIIRENYLNDTDSEVVNSKLELFSNVYNGRILLADRDFKIVSDTFHTEEGKTLLSSLAVACLKGEETSNYDARSKVLELAVPVQSPDVQQLQGVMLVSVSAVDIAETLAEMEQRGVMLIGSIVVLSVFLAWLLSTILVKPLARVTKAIEDLTDGMLDEEISVPDYTETELITDAFNKMVNRMKILDESRQEFVSNVSHELKTPLTSIISYTQLLLEEDLPPAARDYAQILAQKAERLSHMVQDVFEVSKAATGNLKMQSEQIDLCKLIRQTMADMEEKLSESRLSFRVFLSPEPVFICADGQKLYRVFQNLLENVLRYSLEGTRVYLRQETTPDRTVVTIKNISREEFPAGVDLTERFVRGDESRTDGGSGLGLSIASSFVQACGGQFQVETQADLFTALVSFPLDASPSDPR